MEEIIPKESQTIAVKRSNRLLKKIGQARHSMFVVHAWWNNDLVEFIALILICGLNLYLIHPLLLSSAPNVSFSGPIIPFIAQMIILIANIPFSSAVQLTYVFFFLLFPISFYALIRFLTGRRLTALIAVLLSSLPFFLFAKVRIIEGFIGSDGQHIASLGLIPLGIYSLVSLLREGGMKNLIIASFFSAVILLISPFGFSVHFVLAVLAAFSEALLGHGRLKLIRLGVMFILSAAFASFWYNPVFTFWLIFGPFSQELRSAILNLVPLSLFIVPVLATFGFLLFDRKIDLQAVFLACFWTIAFLVLALANKGDLSALSASRFLPEIGISFSFLASVGAVALIDSLKNAKITAVPWLNRPAFSNPLITLVLSFLIVLILFQRSNIYERSQGTAQFWQTAEKGKLWLARENFGGIAVFSGYIITFATIGVFIWWWVLFILLKQKGRKGIGWAKKMSS